MLSQCRAKKEREEVMKNQQNCCTRSKIQSKNGLGNIGSGAYSSASIPTDFGFPFV